jgi:DNA ligase (NAD+)
MEDLQVHLEKIKKEINYHNYRYHVLDNPVISDYEYDQLVIELLDIEKEHPEWVTPDSPSQRAGATPLDKFVKIQHLKPILSLANAFNDNDVFAWYDRIYKLDNRIASTGFVVEPKIDGLTVVLRYENGIFVQGATRGDGIIGEDITTNLRTIRALPLKIPTNAQVLNPPTELVVRGEAFIPIKDFEKLNLQLERAGESTYQNPRNTAAGALRQLDPKLTAKRPLTILVYSIISDNDGLPKMHLEQLQYLEKMGFPIPEAVYCKNINETVNAYNHFLNNRDKISFEADGIVIKIDNLLLAESLGVVGKDPRGAIAYKFPAREVTTRLMDIKVNVGRTGVLTPYAILDPVEIGGVVVRQATLHNFDFILDKDLRIGDWVAVKRAGDVIPYIIGPITDKRTGTENNFLPPAFCPTCGKPVEHFEEEVAWYCVNTSCPAQIIRNLEHFASRGAMEITGLGIKIVEQLTRANLIKDVADIYNLSKGSLLELDGFGEKKADNLLLAIEISKNQPLSKLIYALGIRGVGEIVAIELSKNFQNLDELSNASMDDLQQIEGIGPNIAMAIVDWFDRDTNQLVLRKLYKSGVWPERKETIQQVINIKKFTNMNFVITGSVPGYTREQLKDIIQENGGKVTDTVSKSTNYLLVGEKPGSKLEKAQNLGVKILNINELDKLLEK